MHDDDGKPDHMGPRSRNCHDYCGGWRDPDTFAVNAVGGFHFNVNRVEALGDAQERIAGYWCAGHLALGERTKVLQRDGTQFPITVISIDVPPSGREPNRPHLRSIVVSADHPPISGPACVVSADS